MRHFQLLAHGFDTTGVLLSYKKELGTMDERELVLYDGKEWAGPIFAMPGLRAMLLNVMRMTEAVQVLRVVLWDVPTGSRVPLQFPVDFAEDGLVLCTLQAGDCHVTAAGERSQLPAQSVLWLRCAEDNALENLDQVLRAIVVGLYYKQMP